MDASVMFSSCSHGEDTPHSERVKKKKKKMIKQHLDVVAFQCTDISLTDELYLTFNQLLKTREIHC